MEQNSKDDFLPLHLNGLSKQIENVHNILRDMRALVAENTTQLAYHIKRTDLLEKQINHLDKDVTKMKGFFSVGGWILGAISTAIYIYTSLKK